MGPPFENGGGERLWKKRPRADQASMGPPFENGGGPGIFTHVTPGAVGFNGAAVRKRRRAPSYVVIDYSEYLASMGPPFENGGGVS